MNYTFRTVPAELRDTSSWRAPDLTCLADDAIVRFERMRKGVVLGLEGSTTREAAEVAGCSATVLVRQLNRCLAFEGSMLMAGWFGLVSHRRVGTYQRKASLAAVGSGAGAAGAFEALLNAHPRVRQALELAIEAKEVGQLKGANRTSRIVFRAFLRACRAKEEGLSDEDYPFTTKGKGRRAVERYVRSYLQAHPTRITPWYGHEAAERTRLGTGKSSFTMATQPLDSVEYDEHHKDVIGTIWIPGPAGPQRVPVKRLWFSPLIDVVSHAILGYAIATCEQPSAAMFDEALMRASTRWRQRRSRIDNLSYMDGAGLPYGLVEGMPPCRPAEIKLDNPAAHYANRIIQGARRRLGCVIEFGPIGAWWHNPVVERLFETLESYGFHRLPSSMGSGPADPRRREPVARAVRDGIEQDDLIDLVDVLVANYNATPSKSLGNQSPLQVLDSHLNYQRAPWLPRTAPPATASLPEPGASVERRTVRGALKGGRRPYVEIDGPQYHCVELSDRFELIGRHVWVHVNEWDMRTARCYTGEGELIGLLQVAGNWRLTKHSRADRKAINALRSAGELVLDEAADPIVAYLAHLAKKARQEAARLKAPRVSVSASVLQRARETTGLPVPPPETLHRVLSAAPPTGTSPLGIPKPKWSRVRR